MISKKMAIRILPILILIATLSVNDVHGNSNDIVNGGHGEQIRLCTNVIENGDFETGALTGWNTVSQDHMIVPTFYITSEHAHSGTYSYQSAGYYIEQIFSSAIKPTSSLTLWAKTDGMLMSVKPMIEYIDNTSESMVFHPTSEWKQFTVLVDQNKLVKRVELTIWAANPAIVPTEFIYIDNVVLCGQTTTLVVPPKIPITLVTPAQPISFIPITITLIAPTTTILCTDRINNGDFEAGDFTGWIPFGPAFDGEITNEIAHSGTYSLQLGAVDFIEQQFSPTFNPTTNLTFWAKTEGMAGLANVKLEYTDGTSANLPLGGVDLSPVGEWKQFTVSADETKQVNRLEFSTWETDPIYIDDVSFCSDAVIQPIVTEPQTTTETETMTKPQTSTKPQTTTETTSKVESVIMSKEKEDGAPTPGFMAFPVIVSLIVVALISRRRRR